MWSLEFRYTVLCSLIGMVSPGLSDSYPNTCKQQSMNISILSDQNDTRMGSQDPETMSKELLRPKVHLDPGQLKKVGIASS